MHQTNIPRRTILWQKCAHVHISVTTWCILGYGTSAMWDLCNKSITTASIIAPTFHTVPRPSCVASLPNLHRAVASLLPLYAVMTHEHRVDFIKSYAELATGNETQNSPSASLLVSWKRLIRLWRHQYCHIWKLRLWRHPNYYSLDTNMTWMTKQLGHSERLADLTHHGFVCETDKCLGTRHRFDTSVIVGHVCVSSRTNEPCGYGLVHSKSNHRNVIHEACKSWKPGVCMVSIMKHKPEDFRWVCTYPDIRQDCTGCASAVIWNRLIQVSLYDTFPGTNGGIVP